jgi:hypothetical protein
MNMMANTPAGKPNSPSAIQSEDYNADRDFTNWYHQTFYAPPPTIDEVRINQFLVAELKRLGRRFDQYVEISCEATVHHAVPMVPWVDRIVLSDFRDAAREVATQWRDNAPGAFCWDHYTEMSLRHEGTEASPAGVAERTAELRRKIVDIVPCDVLALPFVTVPLTASSLFGMFFVAGEVGENLDGWHRVMELVTGSIPRGAHFFITALRGMAEYTVHRPDGSDKKYPCAELCEEHFREVLPDLGFEDVRVEGLQIPNPDIGLDGVIMVSARKA